MTNESEYSISDSTAAVNTGSFRDRDGRVYHYQKRIFRGLSDSALTSYRSLINKKFYQNLMQAGKVIGTRELEPEDNPLPENIKTKWAGFLEHDRIEVISYPYEWTFSMLKSAALLQLQIVEKAVSNGFTLKDATPYNVQFVGGKPVFIDIPSFEKLQKGAPWAGYKQFCEMFLFPLFLQVYKGCNFQPFMRASIDGVSIQTAASLFGFRDRFRKGVLSHVWLQSRLDNRYANTTENVRTSLKSAGFNRELILVNVRKLQKLVKSLQWDASGSEWGDYTDFHNYSEADHILKEDFIRDAVREEKPRVVWDIGCNTGQFSRIAAKHCEQVVAMDIDSVAVERLFLDEDTAANILPLLQNVADPSPNWGWRNCERLDLQSRSKPDLILCLALIHHVVITANIPLNEFIQWLASISNKLVIEYVSRKDDKVETLLRNKEDKYVDYSRESIEKNLAEHFKIKHKIEVNDGNRVLYLCVK
ncbi:MAG: class I SAM-dependent methyltransferase [Xanthomonadales bacterium]|nr:class I SAM-dependent methyltransferase [Xanthomonadales bacterium]